VSSSEFDEDVTRQAYRTDILIPKPVMAAASLYQNICSQIGIFPYEFTPRSTDSLRIAVMTEANLTVLLNLESQNTECRFQDWCGKDSTCRLFNLPSEPLEIDPLPDPKQKSSLTQHKKEIDAHACERLMF
jgi:hypothetical protein